MGGMIPREIVLLGTFLLARHRRQWVVGWLALASFAFYAVWDWRFLPLLLASILGNYLIGLRLLAARERAAAPAARAWLFAGVAANLVLLGVFKYAGFFAATGATLLGTPRVSRCASHGAANTPTSASAPRRPTATPRTPPATSSASFGRPLSSRSTNAGTSTADSAPAATSSNTTFEMELADWKALPR